MEPLSFLGCAIGICISVAISLPIAIAMEMDSEIAATIVVILMMISGGVGYFAFPMLVDYIQDKKYNSSNEKSRKRTEKTFEYAKENLPESAQNTLAKIKDLDHYEDDKIQSILNSYDGNLILIKSSWSCYSKFHSKVIENNCYTWALKHNYAQTIICKHSNVFNKGFISISKKEITSSYMQYHPEQLVYTGATVGGVSMGGFHTEEAYYTEQFTSSGKYGLFFPIEFEYTSTGKNELSKIKEIYMSKKMLSNLPKELTPFIKEGKLVLNEKEVSSVYTNSLRSALSQGNQYMYQQLSKQCFLEMHMTNDEATSVLNWINSNFK